jgi:hypothetical protein
MTITVEGQPEHALAALCCKRGVAVKREEKFGGLKILTFSSQGSFFVWLGALVSELDMIDGAEAMDVGRDNDDDDSDEDTPGMNVLFALI